MEIEKGVEPPEHSKKRRADFMYPEFVDAIFEGKGEWVRMDISSEAAKRSTSNIYSKVKNSAGSRVIALTIRDGYMYGRMRRNEDGQLNV